MYKNITISRATVGLKYLKAIVMNTAIQTAAARLTYNMVPGRQRQITVSSQGRRERKYVCANSSLMFIVCIIADVTIPSYK